MSSKKILVMSDNHGSLKEMELAIEIEKPDFIIFAGDYVSTSKLIERFDYYVRGNNDMNMNWESKQFFKIEGIKFFLTHGHLHSSLFGGVNENKIAQEAKAHDCQVAIFGHSHIKEKSEIDGVLVFNPGSISEPRDGLKKSYGVIEIENKKIKIVKHVYIH